MNKLALPAIVFLSIGLAAGYFSRALFDDSDKSSASDEKQPLYWVAPMDPNYRRDEAGKSPMGMDLVPFYGGDGDESDEAVVKISPIVENNLGVRTSKVEKGKLDLKINTVGYVDFDEDKLTDVHSRVDGWIEELIVKSAGDEVTKGQKLFELYSPELVNAQEEYITALKSNNKLLIRASADRLISLGVAPEKIKNLKQTKKSTKTITYYAKHDGFINKLNVREGMFIKPATEIMSIGQLDTVWVIAEIFERQSGWVKKNQDVNMTLESFPHKTWQGKVDYIYPVLDKKTRTLRVRIRFDNLGHYLKPNMFAKLLIASEYKNDALFVKREAIIRNGRMQRIVKALGGGRYKSVVIKTGVESGEFIEVLEGVNENDSIVTSAQFLIDSESSLTASFDRMVMDDNAMDEGEGVWVTGSVLSIMPEHNMLTVVHGPIDAWGQPGMIMDLFINKTLDASALSVGKEFKFLIKDHENGETEIIDIEMSIDSSANKVNNNNQAWLEGEIRNIMQGHNMLTIEHAPVEAWGWPDMTMDFPVVKKIDLNPLKENQKIRFLVNKKQDGSIEIVEIKELGAE